ncbi:hypothetical protein ACFYO1_29530 [Nocardia sp. NPDC006044]|uniref:hypothetical protein n=1 Tax=Nocardia sp. NPDC006044 TaxID=3364306 RepID=UPI0036BD4E63
MAALNADGETLPGVRYTAIASRSDDVITPTDTTLLARTDDRHRNFLLQEVCPADSATHSTMLIDHRSVCLVMNALDGADNDVSCD